jgi:3-oxoacyl-[acyl-carrier-protein] synthase-3
VTLKCIGGTLYLHGLGHYHPPNVIDNSFLESLDIGVDPDWIKKRVGIIERRTVLDLDYIRLTRNRRPVESLEATTLSGTEMGRRAATMALKRAGLSPGDIGLVIAGSCTPEFLIPAEAGRVAETLGIECTAFDMTAACATFVVQIMYLYNSRPDCLPDFVLLVSAESFTKVIDYSNRGAAILFGDGASAAILSTRHPSRHRLQRVIYDTLPSGCNLISTPTRGHFSQDGNAVQRFAIRKSVEILERLATDSAIPKAEEPTFFIGHQANLRMLEAVCMRAKIREDRHRSNVAMFGNCGTAGAPSVLSQYWTEMHGSITNLVQVGSGLSWGGLQIISGSSKARGS